MIAKVSKTPAEEKKPTCDELRATVFIYWIIILIGHLVEFTRIPSELWRQTSSDAIRRKQSGPTLSQPTAQSLLFLSHSFHHSNSFLLCKLFTEFLLPSFIRLSEFCIFCICFASIFYSPDFPSQRGALSDYLARIGSLWAFLHPPPLPSPPTPCENTQMDLIPANHSGFSAGFFYVTIKTQSAHNPMLISVGVSKTWWICRVRENAGRTEKEREKMKLRWRADGDTWWEAGKGRTEGKKDWGWQTVTELWCCNGKWDRWRRREDIPVRGQGWLPLERNQFTHKMPLFRDWNHAWQISR